MSVYRTIGPLVRHKIIIFNLRIWGRCPQQISYSRCYIYKIFCIFSDTRLLSLNMDSEEDVHSRSHTFCVIYKIFCIFSDTRLLSLTSDSEEHVHSRSHTFGVIYKRFCIFSDTRSLSLTSDSEEDVLNRSQTSGESQVYCICTLGQIYKCFSWKKMNYVFTCENNFTKI